MYQKNQSYTVVIIAAGSGSRIVEKTNETPKTLLPFGDGTILSCILTNFKNAGVEDFIIVAGYKANLIKEYVNKHNRFGLNISFVMNPEWQRGNGISVLAAEKAIKRNAFILSMSDHIVSESAINRLITSEDPANLLLVDRNVRNIFDIDDATKVNLKENAILEIGKGLTTYNGIDCGVFRLTNLFFDAMRRQLKIDKESISSAIEILIENKNMNAVFTRPEDFWLDIDTPEAYKFGLENLAPIYRKSSVEIPK
jgi:1L-myo-inositol 1-phosphate cytidylyltransferase